MPKRKSDEVNMHIGRRMKKYRDSCGLTQQQVADILNINRTTYTKYETGVSEPSHELLRRMVKIFGTDFNAILGEEDKFDRDVYDGKMLMYNLSKEEQELIIAYRSLNSKSQAELKNSAIRLIGQSTNNADEN